MKDATNISDSYEALAEEYYDSVSHPTCHNFNYLSRSILRDWIFSSKFSDVLEVGAGDSAAAEALHSLGIDLKNLEIQDGSVGMLAHSEKWIPLGTKLTISDATDIKRADSSVSLIVSSLGDPYNVPPFWEEATRVLRPGGIMIFTMPSFEWSSRFRKEEPNRTQCFADFLLRDGRHISVPSFIRDLPSQIRLMQSTGLVVRNFTSLGIDSLPATAVVSPKAMVFERDESSLVWGFRLHKPSATL